MSKGKISKPSKVAAFTDKSSHDRPIKDIIYDVVQTCEVETDDVGWQNADKTLETAIASLEKKHATLEERVGGKGGSITDEISEIKVQITDLQSRKPTDLIVTTNQHSTIDLGIQHYQLPTLINILSARLNVYLVGPAGSGKTHAARECSKALDVPFYFTGAIASEYKLTGFIDANGKIVSTEFRKAYEFGGIFLFDEIDASYPQAVLAFNAALSNDFMDFPDAQVPRHENFYCIAAANTYGQGADRQYVGRNQLDAASLDRFIFLDWKYDENLERNLAGNLEWTSYVQKVRRLVEFQNIRHVISPRASINGALLIHQGLSRVSVEEMVLWKGIDRAVKEKIINELAIKKMLATENGNFVPVIAKNKVVELKIQIGTLEVIQDYYGNIIHEIKATASGKIIFISKQKNVKVGDLLAEIEPYA